MAASSSGVGLYLLEMVHAGLTGTHANCHFLISKASSVVIGEA